MSNTNPPAFPSGLIDPSTPDDAVQSLNQGMTLRDYFAAKAMQGNIASMVEGQEFDPSIGAEWAYKVADAMLKARDAK
jgi:hypothetical protein